MTAQARVFGWGWTIGATFGFEFISSIGWILHLGFIKLMYLSFSDSDFSDRHEQ